MQANVHDALFKSTFSQTEDAAGMLRLILPPAVAARVDFATLARCSGSFVDEVLKERYSDILFSAEIGQRPALLYLLFEHQSGFDGMMGFRLLRYMVRIWEHGLRESPLATALPIILPVVLHHSEEGWRGSTAFEDLLDADADTLAVMAPYVPRFRFLLEDISHESDEALHDRAMTALGRMALWCLRHSREPSELVSRLAQWADLVGEVRRAPGGAAALVRILRYILEVNEPARPDELLTRLAAAVEGEGEEEIVTAADWLREQGREQGRREIVLEQLRERFGPLPEDVARRVATADADRLRLFSKRVLTAPALEDVLAD